MLWRRDMLISRAKTWSASDADVWQTENHLSGQHGMSITKNAFTLQIYL